jgi:hypothetical protein
MPAKEHGEPERNRQGTGTIPHAERSDEKGRARDNLREMDSAEKRSVVAIRELEHGLDLSPQQRAQIASADPPEHRLCPRLLLRPDQVRKAIRELNRYSNHEVGQPERDKGAPGVRCPTPFPIRRRNG